MSAAGAHTGDRAGREPSHAESLGTEPSHAEPPGTEPSHTEAVLTRTEGAGQESTAAPHQASRTHTTARGTTPGTAPGTTPGTGEGAEPRRLRFAALGDSLTEGLGDPVPGGWRGWAALLAAACGPHPEEPVEFVNVSRSGALAADVADEQLTAARRARPHLASVVVGGNDTLRDSFDIHRVAEALDRTIAALRADGTVVLTACLPDPGRMLGLPAALARPLGRRMRAVNTVVHTLSQRYEAVHVELGDHAWVADRRAWSVDRLHPSELGHRLLAREFHSALRARSIATGAPPSLELDGRAPSRTASAWWMATRGTRWIADRCTDLLPGLVALAALEWSHRLRGTGHLLEDRDRRATLAALTAVTRGPAPALLPHPAADPLPPTSTPTSTPTPSAADPLARRPAPDAPRTRQPAPAAPPPHPTADPLIADTPPPAATMAG
ncbi:SGNH/GDSL hydrolase family protein [Streptomyces sp. 8ZJF_21]|uniref:SGNH/GDSL hydrolase family protein n=1 Tax=Streptomyces sp. 8ZJF_21 TaxID=2903141 RepID=UPI001E41DA6B|nr:SGNH/GDSL hydrolase family protein [Streptomyces sp. 8ZJF_21]MCD9593811.1 SGNH/GDSL hydrolase family protein [Streptomyces sp. 8ZJF_21]